MNTYILNDLKRKWWQIVLVGILCAIVIIVSRTVLVKPIMVHGPINASVIFTVAVSYTHLDVYKRQDHVLSCAMKS